MSIDDFLLVETPRPHVRLVTLNRPSRMNAMAFDVMVPLRQQLEALSDDNDCRVVILTGAGHGFCSGADLEDPGMVPNIDGLGLPTIALRSMGLLEKVVSTIRTMHQPVIGAINGAAIGGGSAWRLPPMFVSWRSLRTFVPLASTMASLLQNLASVTCFLAPLGKVEQRKSC